MKKTPNWRLLATATVVSAALTACGGDDGNDGNDGNPGRPGGEPAAEVNQLNLSVTDVSFDNGLPVFQVLATNEEDKSVVGLQGMKVNVAQLLPPGHKTVGDSTRWLFSGDNSRNGSAEIVDEKNGYYSVTFTELGSADLADDFTRRLNIVVPAGTLADGETPVPNTEVAFDYNAAGAAADYTRNIVTTDSCAACHGEDQKIKHSYTNPQTCASCHDGVRTKRDFTLLVHDAHKVAAAEGKFPIKDSEEPGVVVRECNVCHETAAPAEELALNEWGNWSAIPTKEACSSCHSDSAHISEQPDSSTCATCHTAEGTGVVAGTIDAHLGLWNDAAKVIEQWGTKVEANYVDGDIVKLTVSIVDAAGNKLNASDVVSNIERLELTTNIGPNFPVLGYNQKSSFNAVEQGELANGATIEEGNFVANTGALAFGTGDADTAFTFVGLSVCSKSGEIISCEGLPLDDDGHSLDENYTGMKANLAFTTKSGDAPSMRHTDSLEYGQCAGCHNDNFQIHKGSHHPGFVMSTQVAHDEEGKVIGLDGCVSCHTPEGTYAYNNNGALEQKLHKTHYLGEHDELFQKGELETCQNCHTSFNLDSFAKKGVINTGIAEGGNPFNPMDARYGSPITATCGTCHTDKVAHMESLGGVYNGTKAAAEQAVGTETCLMCHVPIVGNHGNYKL